MSALRSPPPAARACPTEPLLRLVMGPWTTAILWVLSTRGPQRFGALRRAVPGISARVLAARLRMLAEAGLVWREATPTVPPAVRYGLTPRGAELHAAMEALAGIARRWQEEGAAPAAIAAE